MSKTLVKKITKKSLLIFSALIISILSISLAGALSKIKEFSDVPAGKYFTAAVYNMQEKGIIQGDMGKDTYRPADNVNRAEIAVIADRIIYYNDEENRLLKEEINLLRTEIDNLKMEINSENLETTETEQDLETLDSFDDSSSIDSDETEDSENEIET